MKKLTEYCKAIWPLVLVYAWALAGGIWPEVLWAGLGAFMVGGVWWMSSRPWMR